VARLAPQTLLAIGLEIGFAGWPVKRRLFPRLLASRAPADWRRVVLAAAARRHAVESAVAVELPAVEFGAAVQHVRLPARNARPGLRVRQARGGLQAQV
jgi:hypothetical protein